MPLIYSPLSDDAIAHPPRALFPRHAFVMRQIGDPPGIDKLMNDATVKLLASRRYSVKDADTSTGSKDFVERILSLIRGTAITVAIFSGETRSTALANIMLELGFAAMCGKPLIIVKSKDASAPSDLTRTDWIDFDPTNVAEFERKVGQALDEIGKLVEFEELLLGLALDADSMDCAVALDRALKCFLLDGDSRFLDKAQSIRNKLDAAKRIAGIDDLNRLHDEASLIVALGRAAIA